MNVAVEEHGEALFCFIDSGTTWEHADTLVYSMDSPIESWILDSGASFYCMYNTNILRGFVGGNLGEVYLSDDKV